MKNEQLETLVQELKKLAIEQKIDFWKKIAQELEKPRRQKREVNIIRISRAVKDNEIAVVPGKVLGAGAVKCQIACLAASEPVMKRNKTISLKELMKTNPKAKNCRIIC
jgi:large subunit ribosomal protein L18e